MAKTLTLSEFKVDLSQLDEAIKAVTTQAGYIDARSATITTLLQGVATYWASPAELMFNDLQQACTTQMTKLTDLLAEMISRMGTAYQNYLAAEEANFNNFQAPPPGHGGSSHHGGSTHHGAPQQLDRQETAATPAVSHPPGS
jgi:Proteins of 100 residues with WXG